MSAKILGLVLEHFPGRDHVPFVIAITLADTADPDGSNVRPSVARVAKLSRTSERTVQYHLRNFLKEGFIKLVREGGGRGNPTEYRIDVGWLTSRPSLLAELDAARLAPKGAANAPFLDGTSKERRNPEKTPKNGCKKGAAVAAPEPQPTTPYPIKQQPQSGGGGLIFPKLHPKQQQVISNILSSVDHEEAQLILDELAARLSSTDPRFPVGNPGKWIASLVDHGVTPTPAGLAVAKRRATEKHIQTSQVDAVKLKVDPEAFAKGLKSLPPGLRGKVRATG